MVLKGSRLSFSEVLVLVFLWGGPGCNLTAGCEQHCLASMDSHLEAFSRNPTDDSSVVLAFQKLATLTKYLKEVLLSY